MAAGSNARSPAASSGGKLNAPTSGKTKCPHSHSGDFFACGALTTPSYASCFTVAAAGYYVGETLAGK